MIELVIPISTCALRKRKEKGGEITLKLAVSAVRGMVVGSEEQVSHQTRIQACTIFNSTSSPPTFNQIK